MHPRTDPFHHPCRLVQFRLKGIHNKISHLKRRDECFAVSAEHPFGKFYAVGESMEEVSVGCNVGCRCTGGFGEEEGRARVTCAMVDCPMPNRWPEGATCVATVDSVAQCCKSGIKCDAELQSAHVCRDGNQTYYEGQTFTPAGDRDDILCGREIHIGVLKCGP